LGRALVEVGEWERADRILGDVVPAARAMGNDAAAARAAVSLQFVRLHLYADTPHEEIHRELDAALETFEELRDEAGLASALGLRGALLFWRGQCSEALEALEGSVEHARNSGDRVQEFTSIRYLLMASILGPTPVPEVLELLERLERAGPVTTALEVPFRSIRAELLAMQGQLDKARELIQEAKALAGELGLEMVSTASISRAIGEIELLAGNPAAAERELRAACERLEEARDWGHYVTVLPYLADALLLQDRTDEAASLLEAGEWPILDDDMDPQVGLRRSRAKVLARTGKLDEAERLAREAVAIAERTDYLYLQGRALHDLAEVFELAGRPAEAAAALERALELYDRKGHLAMVKQTRVRLADLVTASG
jgi:tetratricopeptide (TPR) repeat protein